MDQDDRLGAALAGAVECDAAAEYRYRHAFNAGAFDRDPVDILRGRGARAEQKCSEKQDPANDR